MYLLEQKANLLWRKESSFQISQNSEEILKKRSSQNKNFVIYEETRLWDSEAWQVTEPDPQNFRYCKNKTSMFTTWREWKRIKIEYKIYNN